MLTSIKALNTAFTATWSSWMGWKSRRSSRTCPRMKNRFMAKVNCPSVTGKRKLST